MTATVHLPPGRRAADRIARRPLAVCADVGSTFTKVVVADTDTGTLVATAAHPTTTGTDVLDGLDAAVAQVAARLPAADLSRLLVCSSAGGGLRLAVVGYESLVTAEAGHRVGLSAGARVVHVTTGRLDPAAVADLRAASPDVLLLVGGTDGGDEETLTHNATTLAAARLRVPVVLAGNATAAPAAAGRLTSRGIPVVRCANVLPRIGELEPGPARAAIRDVFLRHVIGGKNLSRGDRFTRLVRGATPEVVLTAVELLADGTPDTPGPGQLVVVDVGGATTDVYSVLEPDAERAGPRREVAGILWRARTVEGDLGMRHTAPGIVAAAHTERLLPAGTDTVDPETLAAAARDRAAAPDLLPATGNDRLIDATLARLAITTALRRHGRGERGPDGVRRGGKDLRDIRLVIGSGGVLRHAPGQHARQILAAALTDHAGGYPLPQTPRCAVDRHYVLAAVGLLAADHPAAAARLGHRHLR